VNAAGTQLGAAYSDMRYRLGKDFVSSVLHECRGLLAAVRQRLAYRAAAHLRP